MPGDANQILPLGPPAHNNAAQLDVSAADAEELRPEEEKASGSSTAYGENSRILLHVVWKCARSGTPSTPDEYRGRASKKVGCRFELVGKVYRDKASSECRTKKITKLLFSFEQLSISIFMPLCVVW